MPHTYNGYGDHILQSFQYIVQKTARGPGAGEGHIQMIAVLFWWKFPIFFNPIAELGGHTLEVAAAADHLANSILSFTGSGHGGN